MKIEPVLANWSETGHKNHQPKWIIWTKQEERKKNVYIQNPVLCGIYTTYKWPIRQIHRNVIIYEHDMTHAVALYPLLAVAIEIIIWKFLICVRAWVCVSLREMPKMNEYSSNECMSLNNTIRKRSSASDFFLSINWYSWQYKFTHTYMERCRETERSYGANAKSRRGEWE